MNTPLSAELAAKRDAMLARIRGLGGCVVAFSGGVDSSVVAMAAHVALGVKAVAATAASPSLASGELDGAKKLAERIGIAHHIVPTHEMQLDGYRRNGADRCYFCKSELYDRLAPRLAEWNAAVILNGANTDDLRDYRPGMKAAAERGVVSPLIEAGLGKAEVRELARFWDLPVWDKPASPCLSSRVAYGLEVTSERLRRIDAAEAWLRSVGLPEVRVRCHESDLARIEAPLASLPRLVDPELRTQLVQLFRSLGFRYVSLDLEGFRSGSLNAAIGKGNVVGLPIL